MALDFWGPITQDAYGNQFVLVCIDTYTRYVELYQVPSTNHNEVVKTFFQRFILRHGVPKEIMTDNGPPFSSLFFEQLTSLLGANNLFVPAYHPEANGVVERFMSTLRRKILTCTQQANITRTWSAHLRIIQFVYNNTIHSSTGHTPFFLTHGRHPRTPLLISKQQIFDHYQSPPQEFAITLQETLNQAFDIVDSLQPTNSNQQQTKYQQNQKVLLFDQSLSTKQKPRKLKLDWIGPFTITNVRSKSTVDMEHDQTKKLVYNVHISRIKPYHSA